MTDHHDPLDDLASAHLDGERDLPESTDRDLRLRIERLVSAREALRGAEAPIDPERREQAIAAALAAFDEAPFDEAPFDEAPSEGDRVVTPLRSGRRRPLRLVEMAGIAAAVVALALVVPLLGRLDSGSNEDLVAPTAEPTDGAASGDRSPSKMALDSAAPGTSDLGAFSDVDALTDAVRARLATTTTAAASSDEAASMSAPAGGSAGPACPDERASGGSEVFAASATLGGRPVLVIVQEDPAGRRLVVLASDDCSTISSQRL